MGDFLGIVLELVTSLVFWGLVVGAIIAWYLLTLTLSHLFYSEGDTDPADRAIRKASLASLFAVAVMVGGICYFFVTGDDWYRFLLFTVLAIIPAFLLVFLINKAD